MSIDLGLLFFLGKRRPVDFTAGCLSGKSLGLQGSLLIVIECVRLAAKGLSQLRCEQRYSFHSVVIMMVAQTAGGHNGGARQQLYARYQQSGGDQFQVCT